MPAIDLLEKEPQIAVDGEAVHVAYSLLAPVEGGCGGDGLDDLGVYIRSRNGLNAAWSDPVRVGQEGDRLQGFRVVGGVFHLTVTASDGDSTFYHAQSSRGSTRIAIPSAVSTSLRVGDDGHARIAYATGRAIKYARVTGNELSIETVAESDATYLKSPSLVLGSDQRAYVTWTQTTNPGGGCADPEPGPLDGTYVAIENGAGWRAKRITQNLGESGASLTLDPSTGGIDVVVADRSLIHLWTTGEGWSSETIPDSNDLARPVLRRDPVTGALVAFAHRWQGDVFTLTKS